MPALEPNRRGFVPAATLAGCVTLCRCLRLLICKDVETSHIHFTGVLGMSGSTHQGRSASCPARCRHSENTGCCSYLPGGPGRPAMGLVCTEGVPWKEGRGVLPNAAASEAGTGRALRLWLVCSTRSPSPASLGLMLGTGSQEHVTWFLSPGRGLVAAGGSPPPPPLAAPIQGPGEEGR